MNSIIAFLAVALAVIVMVLVPPLAAPYQGQYGAVTIAYSASAVAVCTATAAIAAFFIRRESDHGAYLLKLFVFALLVRVLVGTAIFVFNAQDFFGGDAWTYDHFGHQQMLAWNGDHYAQLLVDRFVGTTFRSGWGMVGVVGVIYKIVGRNMLAIQFFNAVLGAVTAPIIFLTAYEVFKNRRVAKVAGLAVAFYPSLVLWSSQGLKDGPIVFFLALAILATLKLGSRLSLPYVVVLIAALFGVLAFRFYVFYMIAVAVAGAFIVGMRAFSGQSLVRQFVLITAVGLSLTYLGVTRFASAQLEEFGSLERLQRSRLDAAVSAESGFGRDVDVSTTQGALSTIPIGLVYLLFAPFPWQLASVRQSLTIPEMLVWWAAFPLLILGIWFSLRYRLRQMLPILLFTSMLTLAYSVFQGNVGTAYRQRAQILVFYFIFAAVGAVLVKEKREERRRRDAEELRIAPVGLKPKVVTARRHQGA